MQKLLRDIIEPEPGKTIYDFLKFTLSRTIDKTPVERVFLDHSIRLPEIEHMGDPWVGAISNPSHRNRAECRVFYHVPFLEGYGERPTVGDYKNVILGGMVPNGAQDSIRTLVFGSMWDYNKKSGELHHTTLPGRVQLVSPYKLDKIIDEMGI